jgi:hypothetical protein
MVVNDQDSRIHRSMMASQHKQVLRASPDLKFHTCTDVAVLRRSYGSPNTAGTSEQPSSPDRYGERGGSEMTQLEQPPRRAISLSAGIVALAAALVIAVTIVLGMLIPGRVSFPTTEQDHGYSAPNPALVQAEREWQRQREQQGGYVDPLTQAERNWEQQRKQQSPFDGE